MSTRACIKIKASIRLNDDDKKLTECVITLYHHSDGYPEGVGKDLKKYLDEVVSGWADWYSENIATDLVRGAIKDCEGEPDMGYKVAICEHGDCEYGYVIDCDAQTLTCYKLGWGVKPWKEVVPIPDPEPEEKPKRQIKVRYDESLSQSRGRDYWHDPETGRYYVKVDGKWTTTTNNYYLEPDCSVADDIDIIVMAEPKEYHGGDVVYSKVQGKNVQILFAHRTQKAGESEATVDHYMTVDGIPLQPSDVEPKRL